LVLIRNDNPAELGMPEGSYVGPVYPEGKRPKFPSGATTGMRAMMSSWWMKREREPDVAFAGFDRYQRSGGLRS
jgi:hypothetical protein